MNSRNANQLQFPLSAVVQPTGTPYPGKIKDERELQLLLPIGQPFS